MPSLPSPGTLPAGELVVSWSEIDFTHHLAEGLRIRLTSDGFPGNYDAARAIDGPLLDALKHLKRRSEHTGTTSYFVPWGTTSTFYLISNAGLWGTASAASAPIHWATVLTFMGRGIPAVLGGAWGRARVFVHLPYTWTIQPNTRRIPWLGIPFIQDIGNWLATDPHVFADRYGQKCEIEPFVLQQVNAFYQKFHYRDNTD